MSKQKFQLFEQHFVSRGRGDVLGLWRNYRSHAEIKVEALERLALEIRVNDILSGMGLGVLSLGEEQIDAIAAKAVTNVQSAGVALEDHAGDVIHAQIAAAIAEAATQMEAPILERIDAGIAIGKQVAASIDAVAGVLTNLMGVEITLKTKAN